MINEPKIYWAPLKTPISQKVENYKANPTKVTFETISAPEVNTQPSVQSKSTKK